MKVRLKDVGTDRTLLGVVTTHNRLFVHLGITQAEGTVFTPGLFNDAAHGQLVRNGIGTMKASIESYDHPDVNFACYRPYAVCAVSGAIPGVRQFDDVLPMSQAANGLPVQILRDSGSIDGMLLTAGGSSTFEVNFGPGSQHVSAFKIKLNGGLGIGDLGAPVVLQEDESILVGMFISYIEDGTPNPTAYCAPAAQFRVNQGGPC